MAAALVHLAGAAAEAAAVGALAVWLAVAVAAQFMPKRSRLRQSVLGWAIPEWRFFAPQPATFDYVLFARERLADGSTTAAQFVEFTARGRLWPLWHPAGRRQKVMRDMVDALQLGVDADGALDDTLCLSDAYLALLAVATGACGDGSVQFGVLRQEPGRDDEVVIVSRWHGRTGRAAAAAPALEAVR